MSPSRVSHRPQPTSRSRSCEPAGPRAENLPASIAEFAMWDAYYQNSPWYRFIATTQQIDAATPDSLLDLYRARLGDVDDLVVVIVGDTDQDAVAELAARYIGTLPAGEPDSYIDHNPGFPPGIQRITIPVDADAGASGLDVLFGAKVPVTAETLVIADVIRDSSTTCSSTPCENSSARPSQSTSQ